MDENSNSTRDAIETGRLLSFDARLYFRNDLRDARAKALLDSEGFSDIVFAIERFGAHLRPGRTGLHEYKEAIAEYVLPPHVVADNGEADLTWHVPFDRLYDLVRRGRNDALHQGAYARSLTDHAVRLSILIEDGLMYRESRVGDFMVRDASVALGWQPISSIRQTMLMKSFSYLPLRAEWDDPPTWRVISDYQLATFLRESGTNRERQNRLAMSVEEAITEANLVASNAVTCTVSEDIANVLARGEHRFLLVVDEQDPGRLVGVMTPYDLV